MSHLDPIGSMDPITQSASILEHQFRNAAVPASASPMVTLSALESFLQQLSRLDSLDRQNPHAQAWLNTHYQCMSTYLTTVAMLAAEYDYNDYLNVFIDCCQQVGLLQTSWDWYFQGATPVKRYSADTMRLSWPLFVELLWLIRGRCCIASFKSRQNARKRENKIRIQEYERYINALFERNDRLIIIRIDLGYCKTEAVITGIEQALTDIDHLLANRRWNALFDHLQGYIIKTEYGLEKGIHFHALLFFNGSERNGSSHIHLAFQIGEYWKNIITKGRGIYWNSNAQIADFERLGRCGIGLISWSDQRLRQHLLDYVLDYLCKEDQYFRPKQGISCKLLRRGQMPVVRQTKLGRPRQS